MFCVKPLHQSAVDAEVLRPDPLLKLIPIPQDWIPGCHMPLHAENWLTSDWVIRGSQATWSPSGITVKAISVPDLSVGQAKSSPAAISQFSFALCLILLSSFSFVHHPGMPPNQPYCSPVQSAPRETNLRNQIRKNEKTEQEREDKKDRGMFR